MPRTCPMIEKARHEYLTTGEVETALRELHGLTPKSTPPVVVIAIERPFGRQPNSVDYPGTLYRYYGRTIEDALVAAYDATVKLLAELDGPEAA